jgi:hypothetical protein
MEEERGGEEEEVEEEERNASNVIAANESYGLEFMYELKSMVEVCSIFHALSLC